HIRTEKIGSHSGNVAYVIADVIGDGGRVAHIVFGNTGFDLADEIGSDVGGLGINSTADACKQSDRFRTKRKSGQNLDSGFDLICTEIGEQMKKYNEQPAEPENCQAGNAESHNRAAGE